MSSSELSKSIITSPEAQRMLWMVTKGFYDNSRVGLWMFEVIGREYDEMANWAKNLRLEAFPQTCTWSMPYWEQKYNIPTDENLDLETRRYNLINRLNVLAAPMNPARLELILGKMCKREVTVEENVAPYTFRLTINSGQIDYNLPSLISFVRQVKPSHESFYFVLKESESITNYSASKVTESYSRTKVLVTELYTDSLVEISVENYLAISVTGSYSRIKA